MKRFRVWFVVLVMVVFSMVLLAGCGPVENGVEETNNEQEGIEQEGIELEDSAWEITVTGPGVEQVFYIEEIKEMPVTTLEAEKKEETHEYAGVLLSAILEEAGITEANEVTLEASDGYMATISGEVAFSENTILAYMEDGVEISDNSAPIMLVTTDDSPQVWVGQLVSITVE